LSGKKGAARRLSALSRAEAQALGFVARAHPTLEAAAPMMDARQRRKLVETMVVSVRELVFVIVGSVVVSLAVLAALWPWTRQTRRLVVIGLAVAIGIAVWNLALNVTNATALNVDSPVLGLSAQDVGSGVLAFVATALALGLTERAEPLRRVLGASAIVGVVTIIVDLFG
jgi:hypothetical protein